MTASKSDLPSLVARYAGTFHEVIGYRQHVASPLGAWLLLALCSPAAAGQDTVALERILGTDAVGAVADAAGLLASPHPLVAAAAAVWSKPKSVDPRWLASLPAAVTQGNVPGQPEVDGWAREHTFGLIDRFPLGVTSTVYLLLASALATKVSWDCPFELISGTELGKSSIWSKRLVRVLRSPKHPGHSAFICPSERAGDVAVHVGVARGGLRVVSVIAQASVAPADVMHTAHEVAIASALGQQVQRRSLFDLPAGDGPLWSLREERTAGGGPREHCVAVLPAWSARDEHDLTDPRLGFTSAAAALGRGLPGRGEPGRGEPGRGEPGRGEPGRAELARGVPGGGVPGRGDFWEAKQAVMARYSRTGFEAAAVSAMAVRMAMMPRRGVQRIAELKFGHPYAVIAVAGDDAGGAAGAGAGAAGAAGAGPWRGVPVFSAWVADPEDAGDDTP